MFDRGNYVDAAPLLEMLNFHKAFDMVAHERRVKHF